jgi:hypothetical protein
MMGCRCYKTNEHSWFQTFAMFWMLCAFFWVIPRCLNFICRRFRALCLFHLHRRIGVEWPFPIWIPQPFLNIVILHLSAYEDGTECSEMLAYKIRTLGNYPEESMQHKWTSLKSIFSLLYLGKVYGAISVYVFPLISFEPLIGIPWNLICMLCH